MQFRRHHLVTLTTLAALLACSVVSTSWQSAASDTDAVHLACKELTESSGVAVSTRAAGILWSHNDSGHPAHLYAFRSDGRLAAVFDLGVAAVDWEDMCSFERNGKHYLAVADVGDNYRRRKSVQILLVEEPLVSSETDSNIPQPLNVAKIFKVSYKSGASDCEALAYDPLEDQFLLATKDRLRTQLRTIDLQGIDFASKEQAEVTPDDSTTFMLPMVTAADISPDGKYLAMSTYGPAYLYTRNAEKSWELVDSQAPALQLPIRKQGESICFDSTGRKLFATSEFAPTPLFEIEIPARYLTHGSAQTAPSESE